MAEAQEPMPVDSAAAEAAKAEANIAFKEHHFPQAVVGYTRAIDLDPSNAVYYSNRAFAHIKLENFGSAIADATKSLELDPTYVKAYYRRGDAQFALGHFKDSLSDFKKAARVSPRDPDLRRKLAACEKSVKELRFAAALATPEEAAKVYSNLVDFSAMPVDASYKGPRMQGGDEEGYTITLEFVEAMMTEFKEQRQVHKRFAFEIVLGAQRVLKELPSLVDINVPESTHITVCGDVHGQFYDLCNIWELNGLPSESNPYLFNGDFVDRGSFSVEVILTLLAMKLLYPTSMHLARGNHESESMNKMYGFFGEVKAKYNNMLSEVFRETFCWLPLCHVISGTSAKVFVVHGGLFSKDNVTLDDIRRIDRNREPPEDGLMCEMLWSDPGPMPGRQPSKRGVAVSFGADVTKNFLETNNLDLIIRSHEVKDEGYELEHDGFLATVFSAPNYCDQMGNKGAFVKFKGESMSPEFTTFSSVPHPEVRPMAYANSFLNFM
mmetsp:Transcript_24086/g.61749  ORF Transcript_24086/g.61749 Transcript_24086/m.61749 type:complete len:494 (-) Transcript_24086:75-1556(-)